MAGRLFIPINHSPSTIRKRVIKMKSRSCLIAITVVTSALVLANASGAAPRGPGLGGPRISPPPTPPVSPPPASRGGVGGTFPSRGPGLFQPGVAPRPPTTHPGGGAGNGGGSGGSRPPSTIYVPYFYDPFFQGYGFGYSPYDY